VTCADARAGLFKPGPAIQSAWITDARSLAACPWRGVGIACMEPAFLFDGLRGKGIQIAKKDPAKPGSGYVELDLGAIYRVDAFRVTGTFGVPSATSAAQVRHVRLLWAEAAGADTLAWQVAGELQVPYDSAVVESARFPAVSAQFWRFEAVSNWENFQIYPFANVQELELYACPDVDSTRITISNLTGTLTPDNAKMPLLNLATQSPASMRPTAVWKQASGQLTVKLDYLALAYDEISFGVLLSYPPLSAPQPARKVLISVSGNVGKSVQIADTEVFGSVLGIGQQIAAPTQAPAASDQQVPQGSPVQPADSVQVFAVATIAGSSKLALADNTITLSLSPLMDLPMGARVTIEGLAGSLPLLQNAEPRLFASLDPSGVLAASYMWQNSGCAASPPSADCGRLVATVSADVWRSGHELVATISLQNPAQKRTRPSQIIVKTSAGSKILGGGQAVCGVMGPGGTCRSFSTVLDVVDDIGVLAAVAVDSTLTQGEENLITLRLLPNIQVLAGTRLTVSGLVGSSTFSTNELKLHGPSSYLFGFVGHFNHQSGDLVVTAVRDVGNSVAAPAVEMAFSLTNAGTAQAKHDLSLTMSLPQGSEAGTCGRAICDVLPHVDERSQPQVLVLGNLQQTAAAAALVQPVLTSPDFLRALNARGFLLKTVSESSNIADHDAIFTVDLSTNFLARDGSAVTLTGLTGSQNPDSQAFPVTVSGEGKGSTAALR
jgi:hypothetical protein